MAYELIDHCFDVIVVGAGGAGLRATLGLAEKGLKTACLSKVFPTRSHTVSAQGGISASLGNVGEDDWRWHMYDTVKGSDWLGDQDAIEYMCREAVPAVVELEHYGVPFSRLPDGRIYQRAFGGMTTKYGKEPAQRTCAAADRTGHAILHTLYQQALKHRADFFVEYFVLDLLMSDDGTCQGVIAWNLDDGTLHCFRANLVILATGGFGRIYASCTSALTSTGDGCGMAARAGLALQDMEFVQFHPTGLYGVGCLITEAARGEGGYLANGLGERFMERYAPTARDLAGRDVVSRAICKEIRSGRGCGEKKDHVFLHLEHLPEKTLQEKLPGILDLARVFGKIDATKEPLPVCATAHYTMGGVPTNYHGEVVQPTEGGKEGVVPGLMAVGEAACVSVHGANRLGSNSLLDIIVFGRAAALRAAEILKPAASVAPVAAEACDRILARFDALRFSKGDGLVGSLRKQSQEAMLECVGVFRTEEKLREGQSRIKAALSARKNVCVGDSSLIWNSALMEALEFDNLLTLSLATVASAINRKESRGAHAREDFPERDDANWLKHTVVRIDDSGETKVLYRPVKLSPLSQDVSAFPPKERLY